MLIIVSCLTNGNGKILCLAKKRKKKEERVEPRSIKGHFGDILLVP